jgi:hypothetical protein
MDQRRREPNDRARRPARLAVAIVLGVACASGGGTAAQREAVAREELETDRDSFTFPPTTAGPETSILEASYSLTTAAPALKPRPRLATTGSPSRRPDAAASRLPQESAA